MNNAKRKHYLLDSHKKRKTRRQARREKGVGSREKEGEWSVSSERK